MNWLSAFVPLSIARITPIYLFPKRSPDLALGKVGSLAKAAPFMLKPLLQRHLIIQCDGDNRHHDRRVKCCPVVTTADVQFEFHVKIIVNQFWWAGRVLKANLIVSR